MESLLTILTFYYENQAKMIKYANATGYDQLINKIYTLPSKLEVLVMMTMEFFNSAMHVFPFFLSKDNCNKECTINEFGVYDMATAFYSMLGKKKKAIAYIYFKQYFFLMN
ncbi:hypothetical protein MXB_1457 [Myxobolus squamalis]|nr:hypothetical protein MXB_1457 [Myxobolus squamalis]